MVLLGLEPFVKHWSVRIKEARDWPDKTAECGPRLQNSDSSPAERRRRVIGE